MKIDNLLKLVDYLDNVSFDEFNNPHDCSDYSTLKFSPWSLVYLISVSSCKLFDGPFRFHKEVFVYHFSLDHYVLTSSLPSIANKLMWHYYNISPSVFDIFEFNHSKNRFLFYPEELSELILKLISKDDV